MAVGVRAGHKVITRSNNVHIATQGDNSDDGSSVSEQKVRTLESSSTTSWVRLRSIQCRSSSGRTDSWETNGVIPTADHARLADHATSADESAYAEIADAAARAVTASDADLGDGMDSTEFATTGHSHSELEVIQVQGGGVGIGTAQPVHGKLDVEGDINFNGQKLCSVVVPNLFRDSILAPAGWQAADCVTFMNAVAATNYQLGCVFESLLSMGPLGGGAPSPNCVGCRNGSTVSPWLRFGVCRVPAGTFEAVSTLSFSDFRRGPGLVTRAG